MYLIDEIEAFRKALQAFAEQAEYFAVQNLQELIEIASESEHEPEGADPADERMPSRCAFFLCPRRVAVRPDRLPWYTSGFT